MCLCVHNLHDCMADVACRTIVGRLYDAMRRRNSSTNILSDAFLTTTVTAAMHKCKHRIQCNLKQIDFPREVFSLIANHFPKERKIFDEFVPLCVRNESVSVWFGRRAKKRHKNQFSHKFMRKLISKNRDNFSCWIVCHVLIELFRPEAIKYCYLVIVDAEK